MTASELIKAIEHKIKIYGDLEIYRPLNEGLNHCKINNVGVLQRMDKYEEDDDGNLMPLIFFKIDSEY